MSFTHSTSVFLAASVLAILAGCGGSNTDSASDTKKSKANPVTTSIVQVVEHPFHTVFRADAEIVPKWGYTQATSEVGGAVKRVSVAVGDTVAKGQILALLDSQDATDRLQQVGAEFAKAVSHHAEAKKVLAENRVLADKDYISLSALRGAELNVEVASQQERAARATHETATRGVARATVRASSAGVISQRFVNPGQTVAAGTPLFEISVAGALETSLVLPARADKYVLPGAKARVVLDGVTSELTISRRQPTVSVNQTFKAFADAPLGATPGKTFSAEVIGQPTSHLMVPEAALVLDGDQQHVFIVKEGKKEGQAKRVAVEFLLAQDGKAAIKGIPLGTKVAVSGAAFIREGVPVSVTKPEGIAP